MPRKGSPGYKETVVYSTPFVTVRYASDTADFREVAYGPEVRSALWTIGTMAYQYARGISPRSSREVNRDGSRHIHYADSFFLAEGRWAPRDKPFFHRPTVDLGNDSPQAGLVERGWKPTGTPEHRVLRRTLQHIQALGGMRGKNLRPGKARG